MKKVNNLFNHIGNVQIECEKLGDALRKKYAEYEDSLALLDPESDDGQALIEDMNQIRATINNLDLAMRAMSTACYYAEDAQWSIKKLNKEWEA